jgi:hypothetical protein
MYRKIQKKDIEKISIENTITALQTPPQPFALRLYSFLLKGIVRVYAMKLRFCEGDIHVLLNSMTYKKKRIEGKRKAPMLITLPLAEDFISKISETILRLESSEAEQCRENASLRGLGSTSTYENDNDDLIEYNNINLCDDTKPLKIRNKKVLDDKTELERTSLFIKDRCLERRGESLLHLAMLDKSTFLFREINTLVEKRGSNGFDTGPNDIFIGDLSSLERGRGNSSLSFIPGRSSDPDEHDDNINRLKIDELFIKGEQEMSFNERVMHLDQRQKAHAFIYILEMGTNNIFNIKQEYPYGEIILYMS